MSAASYLRLGLGSAGTEQFVKSFFGEDDGDPPPDPTPGTEVQNVIQTEYRRRKRVVAVVEKQ